MDSSLIKVSVLASGSKGNCTYIEIDNYKILVDVGPNFLYLSTKLKEINVDVKEINYVFITHTHSDHIYGLKKILKETKATVYLSKKMSDSLPYEIDNSSIIESDININNLCISVIKLSHDKDDCHGYVFKYQEKEIVYITDTGYINNKHLEKLKNKDIYIMESNHDVEMLMNSNYPHHTKMRIIGDKGHISNKDCAYYLKNFYGDNTKYIFLIHLSEDNNTPEIAKKNILETLNNIEEFKVIVSKQSDRTEMIEI